MADLGHYLWEELHELFDTYDGGLDDINIENLSGKQVEEIYAFLRTRSELTSPDQSFWSITLDKDIPVDAVENAARLVKSGEAACFHIVLHGLTFAEATIPDLGVFVNEDSIELDYRSGSEWSSAKLRALFECLRHIEQLAPGAKIGIPAMLPIWNERFAQARRRYLAEHKS